MNKKIILVLLILLMVVGCGKKKEVEETYVEKTKTYTIGEEKILQEYSPAKEEYFTEEVIGKTTGWSLKPKYEIGKGKDIEPGVYNIESKGWAQYNIFIGAVELNLNYLAGYSGSVRLGPLQMSVCYIDEIECEYLFDGYKRVEMINLQEGDILYTSYEPFSGQGVSIRFVPQKIKILHPREEEQPEIKVQPLELKESIRKYSSGYKCYINDYEVPDCVALKYYDEIVSEFE